MIMARDILDWRALRVAALAVDCGCHRAFTPMDPSHLNSTLQWRDGEAEAALARLLSAGLIELALAGNRAEWRISTAAAAALSDLARPLAPLHSAGVRACA